VAEYLYGLEAQIPVSRIIPVHWFLDDLRAQRTRLVQPSTWEDPGEDTISWMAFQYQDERPSRQRFGHDFLPPAFAQCWTRTQSSAPLWNAYSRVRHNASGGQDESRAKDEGLQLRSTPEKLVRALIAGAPSRGRCYVGSVRYVPSPGVTQEVVNEVGTRGLASFCDPTKRALVALYKREAFSHENEVRLLYVGYRGDFAEMMVPWDYNAVVALIVLDGRINDAERREREDALREAGYTGEIRRPDLYQRTFWQVVLPGPPPAVDRPCPGPGPVGDERPDQANR
jgi:hypothetical protein